jgi:hypothetical protein
LRDSCSSSPEWINLPSILLRRESNLLYLPKYLVYLASSFSGSTKILVPLFLRMLLLAAFGGPLTLILIYSFGFPSDPSS